MKVMQVNKLFYPVVGGIEQVVYDLSTGLKPYVNQSIVLASNKNRKTVHESIDGVDVYRIGSFGMYWSMPLSPTFPLWLRKLSKTLDILHFHYPFPLGDTSYVMSQVKVPAVVTWHSEIVRQRRFVKYYLPFLNTFLKRARRVVVTSPQVLDNSQILFPFRDKCEVIPLGIDLRKYQLLAGDAQTVEELNGRYGHVPVVLFVGRLVYYKGIEYLIRAMKDVPDAVLFVVGTGPLENDCRTLVRELELEDRVVFWGHAQDADLRILYHACDVFVLPSVESSEAFGLVQLEAMSCGKPVVSCDLPTGVPFVNQHGTTGYVVPPKDPEALARAIRDILFIRGTKSKLGQQALQRVTEQFSREGMVDRIAQLYQEID